jgi:hypothetical protein
MDVYIHPPIRLHGIVLNSLSTWIPVPLPSRCYEMSHVSNLLPGSDSFTVIRCNGNVFSDPLLSNGRLLRLNHSGLQPSCHIIFVSGLGVVCALQLLHNNNFAQSYWVLGLRPSSGILETRNHKFSETGSVSVLRWYGRHLLCWVP